jgi:hypothetical protein
MSEVKASRAAPGVVGPRSRALAAEANARHAHLIGSRSRRPVPPARDDPVGSRAVPVGRTRLTRRCNGPRCAGPLIWVVRRRRASVWATPR